MHLKEGTRLTRVFSYDSHVDSKKSRQTVDAVRIIVSFGCSNLKNLSNPEPGWSNRLVFTCKLEARLFSVFLLRVDTDCSCFRPARTWLAGWRWTNFYELLFDQVPGGGRTEYCLARSDAFFLGLR